MGYPFAKNRPQEHVSAPHPVEPLLCDGTWLLDGSQILDGKKRDRWGFTGDPNDPTPQGS